MSNKKNRYIISVNNTRGKSTKYEYKYYNTALILFVYKAGFVIETEMTTKFDSVIELLTHRNIDDALRKGMLAFLIHNSKTITINSVAVSINGDGLILSDEEKKIIDSSWLVKVERGINFGGKDDIENIVNYLLNWKRSDSDSRISSLFAYICARSYEYETQKLQFNWMAMNGLYGYLASKIKNMLIEKCGLKPNYYPSEAVQIELMMMAFDFISNINPSNAGVTADIRKKTVHSIDKTIEKWNGSGIPEQEFFSDIQKTVDTVINNSTFRIDGYGFLLLELSYYLRCNLFHADHPVNLLARKDDFEIKRIKLTNLLMDAFLSENIPYFFNDSFINQITVKFQNAVYQYKMLYFTEEEQQ